MVLNITFKYWWKVAHGRGGFPVPPPDCRTPCSPVSSGRSGRGGSPWRRIIERANNGVRLTIERNRLSPGPQHLQEFEGAPKPTSPPCTSSKKACSAVVFPRSPAASCSRICSPNTASFTPASTSRFRNRAAPRWNRWCFRGISILPSPFSPSRRIFRGSRFGTNRSWSSCPRIIPSPIANASKWMNWQTTPSSASSRASCSTTASRPSAASVG